MNAGPDVERRISAWLAEEVPTRAPDRILPAVFQRSHHATQRRFGVVWRSLPMNSNAWRLAAAAVVGVLIIGAGAALLGRSSPGDIGGPGPTPSPSPTPPAYPTSGVVAPGTYLVRPPDAPAYTVTMPAGWQGGGEPVKNDGTSASLANQPLRNATTPTDVTLGGYSGKYLELTVPIDLDFATCSQDPGQGPASPHFFVSWVGLTPNDTMGYSAPRSHDRSWILDVAGVRVLLDAIDFPDATAQDRAELQSIIDSIQISPIATGPSPTASP